MDMSIKRIWPSAIATLGALYVEELSQCFSLEPGSAEGKGPIAALKYNVILLPSPHFMQSTDPWVMKYAKQMPHLEKVPGRTCVMLHWGDFPEDTEGCPCVGNVRMSASAIGDSRSAFSLLYTKILQAFARKELVSLDISDNGSADEVWPNA
jgi:hypothetical protein